MQTTKLAIFLPSGFLSLLLYLGLITAYAQGQQLQPMTVEAFENQLDRGGDSLIIYNFWATWCGPCIKELPHFERISEEYADKKVKIVLVSLDFKRNWETVLPIFIERGGLQSEVIYLLDGLDQMDWIERMSPAWEGSIPATLAIANGHELREFREQEFTYQELKSWVKDMLGQMTEDR